MRGRKRQRKKLAKRRRPGFARLYYMSFPDADGNARVTHVCTTTLCAECVLPAKRDRRGIIINTSDLDALRINPYIAAKLRTE